MLDLVKVLRRDECVGYANISDGHFLGKAFVEQHYSTDNLNKVTIEEFNFKRYSALISEAP